MDRLTKRRLKDIATHLSHEELKLRKQAANLRRSIKKSHSGGRGKPLREDNWEEVLDEVKTKRTSSRPSPAAAGEGGAQRRVRAEPSAIVVSISAGRCRVFEDGALLDCILASEIAMHQQTMVAVGDRVEVENGRVVAVAPRRTRLSRPDPLNPHRERVIAANVDVVIHVVSVKTPPFRPRLIDRFLVAIGRGGAQPVICVNKIDLLTEPLPSLDVYRDLGVPVIRCSTVTGEGIDELRDAVQGKTCALVGHSGVGKSSLLNALDAALQLATKRVERCGRHTTTASTLYDFGGGTYLIDTPGIRELGLWNLDAESLAASFPELDDARCRFADCRHDHEPDCEVKARVDRGEMSRLRYETYLRLLGDLAE
jgi:ribosome biogenesis GTPase